MPSVCPHLTTVKTTFVISVIKVVYWVVLVFSISNFFNNKNSQGRKLSEKNPSFSNSALGKILPFEVLLAMREKTKRNIFPYPMTFFFYITIHQNFAASTFGKIIKMGSGGVSSMAGRCFLRDQRLILWFLLTIATESKGQKQVINR